jgi:cell division septation protein DedD
VSLSRRPAGAPNDLTPSSISMSSPRMPRVGTEGTSGASERAEVLDQPFTTVLAPESPRPAYCNSAKLGPHRSAGVPLVQAPAQRYRFDMVATRVGGSVDPRRSLWTFDPQVIAHAPSLVVDPLRRPARPPKPTATNPHPGSPHTSSAPSAAPGASPLGAEGVHAYAGRNRPR